MSDQEQTPRNNIYAAPNSDLLSPPSSNVLPLAGRGERFFAALIDGLILGALNFGLLILYFGSWHAYLNAAQDLTIGFKLGVAVIGLVIFAVINGKFLADNGQTIGKKLVGIKIVRTDGSKLDLQRFFTHRYLPIGAVQFVPVVGPFLPLLDVLFIFRTSHQCLHDQVADTIVVDAAKAE